MKNKKIFKMLTEFVLNSEKRSKTVAELKYKIIELLAKEVNNEEWVKLFIIFGHDKEILSHSESMVILGLYGPNGSNCEAFKEHANFIWNRAILINIAATTKED